MAVVLTTTAAVEVLKSMYGSTYCYTPIARLYIADGARLLQGSPQWSSASSGVAQLNPVPLYVNGLPDPVYTSAFLVKVDDTADSFCRTYDGYGRVSADLTTSEYGGGGDVILDPFGFLRFSRNAGGAYGQRITNFALASKGFFGTILLNVALRNAIANAFGTISGYFPTTPYAYGPVIGMFHAANPTNVLLYTGTAPATADVAATGTLLATIPLLQGDFTAPTGNSLALTAPVNALAVADGTVGYARIVAANGCTMQCTAGTSGMDITLDLDDTITSDPISINEFILSVG